MAMTVRDLVEHLNQVKASVEAGETPDLAASLQRVRQRLRETFDPDALRAALRDGAHVPTELEEEVTTLRMEWMSRRGAR